MPDFDSHWNRNTITPAQFAVLVAQALSKSTAEEAARLVDHAKAWAWKFYDGREPAFLADQLTQMEAQLVSHR